MKYSATAILISGLVGLMEGVICAEPPEIILWPDGVPEPVVPDEPAETLVTAADGLTRRFNVSQPRLFVHIPDNKMPGLRAAVIVVPGGGFARLADEHEGSDVCRWLNKNGIAAFQLAYRTPTNQQTHPEAGPVEDLRRAVALVRTRAAEFRVDPDRVGVMGFSAGGQTALMAAARPHLNSASVPDASTKPNAVLLIYPWNIRDEALNKVHAAVSLNGEFPPVFIAQAADDTTSPAANSARLFLELSALKVPVEFHVYEKGGHGFGMRPRVGAPGTADWLLRAVDWLKLRGFITGA